MESASLVRALKIFFSVLVMLLLWFCPFPEGISSQARHLFAIFIGTLSLVITGAVPMGASTLIGLSVCVFTKTLTFEMAFSGYNNSVVWLVLVAFFISQGFIVTGLGKRVSYHLIRLIGKSSLGLGYGLALGELFLAPAVPSITARSGAIVYPIAQSLSHAFNSYADDESRKRLGSYLILVAFHAAAITSAMFLTAMAGNPLAASLAEDAGVHITWYIWAKYAVVPGLVSLMLVPLVVYWIMPPTIKKTPHAVSLATEQLDQMGPMSKNEWIMLFTFLMLLVLWVFGDFFQVKAVTAALLGLICLLLTGVVKWKNILALTGAWDTFIWFGAFVAMAGGLNHLGLTAWFGNWAASGLVGLHWTAATLILLLIYFYVHYFFASSTAQIGALYLPFLLVSINLGAPAIATALAFAYVSNLYGGLTHYGFGSAPILFGSGFVGLKKWLKVGFVISSINLCIWLSLGAGWWYWLSMS